MLGKAEAEGLARAEGLLETVVGGDKGSMRRVKLLFEEIPDGSSLKVRGCVLAGAGCRVGFELAGSGRRTGHPLQM